MSNQITTTRKSPIDLNDKYDKADVIGTLIVVLLKARNLNDKHSFRKSDVFAQAILNGTQKRTHVDIKGGQHPEWDGEVRFPVLKKSSEKFRKMEVFCFSVEPRSEDLMGKGIVDISETLRTGEFDDWVPLEVDGVARGELYLEMTYYANTPPPTPAAASNKLLQTVQSNGVGLTRHPSKLAPADRLSRPQQNGNISVNQGPALQNVYTPRPSESQVPIRQDTNAVSGSQSSSLHGTSATPHGLNAEKIGKGSPLSTLSGQKQQPQVNTLPNILRPGLSSSAYNKHEHGRQDSITSPTPNGYLPIQSAHNGVGHVRLDSTESPYTASALGHKKHDSSGYNPYIGGEMTNTSKSQHSSPPRNPYVTGFTPPTNPYLSAQAGASSQDQRWHNLPLREDSGTPNVHTDSRLGFHGRTGTPLLWQQENTDINSQSNFTFPKPSMPTAYFDDVGSRLDDRKSPRFHASANNVEAHTQTRYQSPLPLPPGSDHSGDNLPKTSGQSLDQSRINAIRRAEEEALRRREQELRDMELAMQLDRELNMTEGPGLPQ